MKLIKARTRGFQSFRDSGDITFSEGINLVIGQNNSGKSALLRAMLPTVCDDRHRTPERWETHRLPQPEITLTIEFSGAEIRDWVLRAGGIQYFPLTQQEHQDATKFMQEFFGLPRLAITVTRRAGSGFGTPYPSHQLFINVAETGEQYCVAVTPIDGELTWHPSVGPSDSLPALISNAWSRDMFYFAAERMSFGEAPVGYSNRLLPTAANLPNVLHVLSSERGDVFDRLVDHLRDIFQTVGNLSVRTKPDNSQLEVRIWPTEAREQVELSFPLSSSGTGVAQVIALLTAIMTVKNAVVIVDEINSFLHPAAVKTLLRILQTQYTQHQYIISTHAPEVISFSNPSTIHIVKRVGYESSIKKLDIGKVGHLRNL